jgi:hypothetical protein
MKFRWATLLTAAVITIGIVVPTQANLPAAATSPTSFTVGMGCLGDLVPSNMA